MPKLPSRDPKSRAAYAPPDYSVIASHFELRMGFPDIAEKRRYETQKKGLAVLGGYEPKWAFFPSGGPDNWDKREVLPAPRIRITQCYFDDGGMDPDDYGWHLEGTLQYCVDPYAWSRLGFRNVCVERKRYHTEFEVVASTDELINEICGIHLAESFKKAVE